MTNPLYSQRLHGSAAPVHNSLPLGTKNGLVAHVTGMLDAHWLAEDFPDHCSDGGGSISGTDRGRAIASLQGHIPAMPWPLTPAVDDETLFDVLEFVARHVTKPAQFRWHDYLNHWELRFDRPAGRAEYRGTVNEMLQAGGTVFKLQPTNRIERIGNVAVQKALEELQPRTGDAALDNKIVEARRLYRSPKDADQQLGLQELWDAFEQMKTLGGLAPKAGVQALLANLPSQAIRDRVDADMTELTEIGNDFSIRHHKSGQQPAPQQPVRDYLFARLTNTMVLLLKASGRL